MSDIFTFLGLEALEAIESTVLFFIAWPTIFVGFVFSSFMLRRIRPWILRRVAGPIACMLGHELDDSDEEDDAVAVEDAAPEAHEPELHRD
eukprot:m.8031 g.8031  ORF g.8031 m.8031 type:complete len:91 (+) comp2819_c0_seq1:152-424(+)